MSKKRECPNFDALSQKPMTVPFVFPGGDVGVLEGKCRGFGAITGNGRRFEETIGVYTAEGDYFNVTIDLRVQCAIPTFWIGDTTFYYPVTECATMGCKVDPHTGNLVTNPLSPACNHRPYLPAGLVSETVKEDDHDQTQS